MKHLAIALIAWLISAPAFADCTTPAGYTRWGSSTWRITERLPNAVSWRERLPANIPSDIPSNIATLGQRSTGIGIHIRSNTAVLRLCWQMAVHAASAAIWSQSGVSGIDVYYRPYGTAQWRWLDLGEAADPNDNVDTFDLGASADREFLIYLPSFRQTLLFRIETPSSYTVSVGPQPTGDPLVVYGSSIVQGSGTSRAGIGYPQALGRYFGVDTVNLGFSGSCQMFAGMATLLATIDASAYVIDCFPNMSTAQVNSQMQAFIDALATAKPNTPIYIVQDRLNQAGGPHPSFVTDHAAKEAAALSILATLELEHSNLTWIPADDLLGDDYEGTVDGSHPSDLGHYRYFLALRDAIGSL